MEVNYFTHSDGLVTSSTNTTHFISKDKASLKALKHAVRLRGVCMPVDHYTVSASS